MSKIVASPSAKEAEGAILGIVLLDCDSYHQAREYITNDNVFYDDRNKMLWNKIQHMISNNEHVDQVTLCSDLTENDRSNGLDEFYITGLTTDAGTRENLPSYGKVIYKKYLMRRLIEETHKIQNKAYLSNGNAYEVLNNTHTTISALMDLQPQKHFDIGSAMAETIENIKNSDRNLIPIGYPSLDKMSGGLTRGEITIIGGRPGHGKSTLSLNMLKNMIDKGYKCVMFNREMSNTEMLKKLVVLESGLLSYSMVRSGALGNESTIKEMNRTVELIKEKYNKNKFLMFDNIRDFNQAATEVKRFNPDVIFDDYIQLIVPDNKINERRLQLEKIIHEYKWLAKNVNAAVVLVSQLNRSLETRGNPVPRLSDLAESGAIEQAAENVFFTYYDYKIFKNKSLERGYGKEIIEIIAGKVRYGETGSAKMDFKGDGAKISERFI
tara:strand:- start:2030 stop:3346 length:1317 start_codon:yes stop_codon:yes gene_type:complete